MLLREVYSTIISPRPYPEVSEEYHVGIRRLFTLLGYNFFFTVAFILLVGLWLPLRAPEIESLSDQLDLWQRIVVFAVLGPLFEEIAFRLPLKWNFCGFIFSSIAVVVLICQYVNENSSVITTVSLIAIVILLAVFLIGKQRVFKNFWHRKYKYFFYTYFFLFVFLHLFNFTDGSDLRYVVVLLPFIFSASCIVYLRLRYGFIFGLMFHCLNNLIFLP